MLHNHSETDTARTLIVNRNAFADSLPDLFVRTVAKAAVGQWRRNSERREPTGPAHGGSPATGNGGDA